MPRGTRDGKGAFRDNASKQADLRALGRVLPEKHVIGGLNFDEEGLSERVSFRGDFFSRLGLDVAQGVLDPFPGGVMAAVLVFTRLDEAFEAIRIFGYPGLEGVLRDALRVELPELFPEAGR